MLPPLAYMLYVPMREEATESVWLRLKTLMKRYI
jgi:hypothetical protein